MTRTKVLRMPVVVLLTFSVSQLVTYNHLEFRTEALYNLYVHGSFALCSLLVGLICILLLQSGTNQAGGV